MKVFLLIFLFVFLSLLLFLGFALSTLFSTPRQGAEKVVVKVERGERFTSVVHKLKEQRVISDERLFSLWARLRRLDKKIQWGFYHFDLPIAPAAALTQMVPGKGQFQRVTIPEGLTVREVADLLHAAKVADRERLLAAAASPELIQQLGLEEESLEGHLFPDTYYFPAATTEAEIITMTVEQFHALFDPMMRQHAQDPALTPQEVLTLASLIEKETANKAERPLVSAVFHNRLKRGLPLQSDPTAIYGLDDHSKIVTHKDLQRRSAYNTYRVKGLPPGPICNPGLSSLQAALAPAAVPYLYFVSKNDGSHVFSVDLADHNRAVKFYQGGG